MVSPSIIIINVALTLNGNDTNGNFFKLQVHIVYTKDAAGPQEKLFRKREKGVEYYVDHRKGEFFIVTNANSTDYKVHWSFNLIYICICGIY